MDAIVSQLPVLAAVFLLGGAVKGLTGLGLPTLAMALGTLVVSAPEAAALLLVPSLATNLWQAIDGPAVRGLLRRFWPLLLALCAGAALGRELLAPGGATWLLGLILLLYALMGLAFPAFALSERWARRLQVPVGLATGLLTAATGVFVLPLVPYLQALRLERNLLVQAMGLGFTVATLALAGSLAGTAVLSPALLELSLALLLPTLAGLAAGVWLRGRLSPALFRRCLFLALGGIGLHLLLP